LSSIPAAFGHEQSRVGTILIELQMFLDTFEATAVDGAAAVCSNRSFVGLGGDSLCAGKIQTGGSPDGILPSGGPGLLWQR